MGRARIVNHTMKQQHNQKSLKYNWHEAYVTVLEGVLARGDRKVADAIETAYKMGALYDACLLYTSSPYTPVPIGVTNIYGTPD